MLPKVVITIDKEGNSVIEGQEKTSNCHVLSEMGKRAGKVTSDKMKDHPPVHQSVTRSM
jgi:hypothetical protein